MALYERKVQKDANAFSTDGKCETKVCATFANIKSKPPETENQKRMHLNFYTLFCFL